MVWHYRSRSSGGRVDTATLATISHGKARRTSRSIAVLRLQESTTVPIWALRPSRQFPTAPLPSAAHPGP